MTGSRGAKTTHQQRRDWMAILARSEPMLVQEAWLSLVDAPRYDCLRGPETGLVMVRGRAGGSGTPFNVGEMTVTRCVVRLVSGETGFAYVAGRDTSHSERAAALDALLQNPEWRDYVQEAVIAPLRQRLAEARRARQATVAATKVDFFTLVRGD